MCHVVEHRGFAALQPRPPCRVADEKLSEDSAQFIADAATVLDQSDHGIDGQSTVQD